MRSLLLTEAELRARSGRKWHEYADDVLPAWVAEMDFEVAEPIRDVLRALTDEAAYGYEPSGRNQKLAEIFGSYMQRRYGWSPDIELVLPVADLVQALFAAVTAFTAPDDGVVLQTPIYPPFQHAVRETGRHIVENPLRDDGSRYVVDTDSLESVLNDAAPLLLLCNPHNPTGRVLERAELEAIARVVVERQLVVVADEVHADLTYGGARHIPIASLGPEIAARTITITSATKAYNIPGLRCGLMHFGSSELRERFRRVFPDRLLGTVNRFGVEATVVAWRDCDDWLAAAMEPLRTNRARLERFVASDCPSLRWYPPDGTYLAWLDCRELDLPQAPQHWFLERKRVALSAGADFLAPDFVRLNFGTSPEILEKILARMQA